MKFNVDSKNAITKPQHVFTFLDNCICVGNAKFSLLWGAYSQSAVNVLTSSPKISDLTKNDFFKLNLAQNEGRWCFFFSRFQHFSETGPLMYFGNHIFRNQLTSEILKLWGSTFFQNVNYKKCIWIGIAKFSLLWREYSS